MSRAPRGTPRLGVLTYDLQPFTGALLERLQAALPDVKLTAYPCFFHSAQGQVRVAALPSQIRAQPFGVRGRGVQEAFTSSINVRAAWRLVADNDVVMLYGLQGATALLVVALSFLFRRTAISVNHSLSPEMERQRRWWIRALKRVLLGGCDWHVCQMPAAHRTLSEVYGISPQRMFLAPFEGGASLYRSKTATRDARRTAVRQRLGVKDDEVLYLFVGNIIPLKGPSLFIRAIAQLTDRPVRGLLAGPEEPGYGPEGTIEYYRQMTHSLGVADKVALLGPQDSESLADLYAASDVFVLPTYKDCMPKVFIEAALFGLPIVTTVAPGSVGVLPDPGRNGFAVRIGELPELVDAMRALQDRDRRTVFASAIAKDVAEFCDPVRETDGFVAAVKAAVAGGIDS